MFVKKISDPEVLILIPVCETLKWRQYPDVSTIHKVYKINASIKNQPDETKYVHKINKM